MYRLSALSGLVVLVFGLIPRTAHSQESPTLAGTWSASALTSKWIIGDWGTACGPKPGGGNAPATTVTVAQVGKELRITGGGRTYSTATCWEEYPGLKVIGHSSGSRNWKTTCKTSAGDPRQASLATTLTATDNSISFYEAGQYQFVIQGQNCTASVGRYRTYSLVQRAGESPPVAQAPAAPGPPSAAAPGPAEEPKVAVNRCAEVGPATRLEVSPSRKLMRPGEEFTFRTVVLDSKGCAVRSAPTWELSADTEHAEIFPGGTIRLKETAPEGVLQLAATVGGRSARVQVEVASKERYDALLASGDFDQTGAVQEAATVAIASSSVGTKAVLAEDKGSGRKAAFLGIVGAVALVLGIVGFVVLRRNRAARKTADQAQAFDAPLQPESAAAAPLPTRPPPRAAAPPAPLPRGICPVCGSLYPPESKFCGKDGATLVPVN